MQQSYSSTCKTVKKQMPKQLKKNCLSELHLLDISPKSVHFRVVNRGLKREDRGEDHSCWWQPLICGFSRYVGNFLKMWAEELLMIEKMVTSLQNPSAHISGKLPTYLEKARPLEKIPVFGGKKGPKLYQIFCMA